MSSVTSLLRAPFKKGKWLAKNLAKKVRLLTTFARNAHKRRKNSYYIKIRRRCPVQPKTILWEAFYGRGLLDNPYALFVAMREDPHYADWQHIWVLDKLENHQDLIRQYQGEKSVRFVEFQSYAYMRALATTQVLVNNVTFWQYFITRPEQTYINTWHGIPLKMLGVDENRLESTNLVRNFLHADYLLSANTFLSSVYKQSFMLGSLFQGEILEEGYPRLDTLVKTPRDQVIQTLRDHGVAVDDTKKIILYAPTWRGIYSKPTVDVEQYIQLKERLEQTIDRSQYQVLVKPHQVVYNAARASFNQLDCMIPATIDANAVLSATDILISDFSSIFYDFLATRRPIVFYIPDLEHYSNTRGLYASVETLPGPVFDTLDALAEGFARLEECLRPYAETYAQQRGWSLLREPGDISKTILEHVLEHQPVRIATKGPQKKTLLFVADLLRLNGITSAMINLFNMIDHQAYDVTLLTTYDKKEKNLARVISQINPNVRVLSRKDVYGRTFLDEVCLHVYNNRGESTALGRLACPKHYLREEIVRYLGVKSFDSVIDFVGYSIFYATLALVCNAKTHLIWAHNEMERERKTKMAWLPKLFSLYPKFDALVSCSKSLCEQNQQVLGTRYPTNYTFCKNLIFAERVLEGLTKSRVFTWEEEKRYALFGALKNGISALKAYPLFVTDADGTVDQHPARFLMVGRLSPEKNYENTIRAFARFLKTTPHALLYIVSAGPLQKKLQKLIDKLKVSKRVFLMGSLHNPATMMALCDCFVLTSRYEGQPMVIHEARVAHMPIIMSTFASHQDAIIDNGQYLVESTIDSIQEGFQAFVEGRVPSDYTFDYNAYNAEVLQQFEQVVNLKPATDIATPPHVENVTLSNTSYPLKAAWQPAFSRRPVTHGAPVFSFTVHHLSHLNHPSWMKDAA